MAGVDVVEAELIVGVLFSTGLAVSCKEAVVVVTGLEELLSVEIEDAADVAVALKENEDEEDSVAGAFVLILPPKRVENGAVVFAVAARPVNAVAADDVSAVEVVAVTNPYGLGGSSDFLALSLS